MEEGRAGLRVEGRAATSPLLHSPPRESVSVVLGQHFFNRTTDVTQTFGIEKYIPYPLYSVFNPSDHDLGEAPPGPCAGSRTRLAWGSPQTLPGGMREIGAGGGWREGEGEEEGEGCLQFPRASQDTAPRPRGLYPCDSVATFGCHGPCAAG